MRLPKLYESVILIDAEFLINMINDNYAFYTDLYKGRKFPQIELSRIIKIIASTARILQENEKVNVVFFSKLGNDILPHTTEPNSLFVFADFINNPVQCIINNCVFEFAYYFADSEEIEEDEEEYYKEFGELLLGAAYDQNTFNICIIADNEYYNYYLDRFADKLDKTFFVFKGLDSGLGVDSSKFSTVTFDYVIARCMGLNESEW